MSCEHIEKQELFIPKHCKQAVCKVCGQTKAFDENGTFNTLVYRNFIVIHDDMGKDTE